MKGTVLLLIIFCFSCKMSDDAPQNLIPKDKMIEILVDIHVTDGMFTSQKVREEYIKLDTTNYYNVILEKYGYTRKDFDTSVFYYSHSINEYDKIYIEVLNRLNEMETEVKEEEQTQEILQTPE